MVRRSLSLLPLLLLACPRGGEPTEPSPATPRAPAFDFSPTGPVDDAELSEFHVVMECAVEGVGIGALTFTVLPEHAPVTVRAFLRLCDEGWYDGTTFHRILREFVVQGGDRAGDGTGRSPYGPLPREPSLLEHHYGTLAMADPPSMQFFVGVAESPHVWALDLEELNVFGRLAHGVQTLETIAGTNVQGNGAGERSEPLARVTIVRAEVRRGPPPETEEIARPRPDLRGEPELVGVQHILVTFLERGRHLGVTRDRREAEARAREAYERIRSGELSFDEAQRVYSDEEYPDDVALPVRRITNYGVVDLERQRARQDAVRDLALYTAELRARVAAGELDAEAMTEQYESRSREVGERVGRIAAERREDVGGKFYGDVAFRLAVGEVGIVPYHPYDSPGGWYVLRRVE